MIRLSPFGEFANEKAEQVYLESLRRMTLEQRWRAVAAMRQVAVEMVRARIRAEHPEWSEQSVRWETTRQVMAAHGLSLGRTIPGRPTGA
ncbi:MAG: hypothetical protein RMK99_06130 [Anaerolineales bacterium]|nr:hypothetical protein [Anaerolineales bacterium]